MSELINTKASIERAEQKEQSIIISLKIKNGSLDSFQNIEEGKEYRVKISSYNQRRSLNANAYYWQLLSKLAEVLKIGNNELHERLIKEHSNFTTVKMLTAINPAMFFKYYDDIETVADDEALYTYYKIYKGSSQMDSKEMSRLIDGLIQECKEQGIEVLSDAELDLLKGYER